MRAKMRSRPLTTPRLFCLHVSSSRSSFPALFPLLLFFSLLLFSLSSLFVAGATAPLGVTPAVLRLGQPVTITIAEPAGKSLAIRSSDAAYRYQGGLPNNITFTPPATGEYTVVLTEERKADGKADAHPVEEVTFTVTESLPETDTTNASASNASATNTTAGTNTTGETGVPTASVLALVTDKKMYLLGEQVFIIVTTLRPDESRLLITTPNGELRYTGSLPQRIPFTPRLPGKYLLTLRLGGDERHVSFTVALPGMTENASGENVSGENGSMGGSTEGSMGGSTEGSMGESKSTNSSQTNTTLPAGGSSPAGVREGEGQGTVFSITPRRMLSAEIRQEYVRTPTRYTRSTSTGTSLSHGKPSTYTGQPSVHTRTNLQRLASVTPVPGEQYEAVVTPRRGAFQELVLHDFTYEPGVGPLVDEKPFDAAPAGERLVNTLVLDLSGINMTDATLTRTAKGRTLYKCPLWNFTTRTCVGSWHFLRTLTPGEAYTLTLTPDDPAFGEDVSWWDLGYQYRRQFNITGTLTTDQPIKLALDTATLIADGKLQADGDDLRILWYNDTSGNWTELNREVVGINESATLVWFRAVNGSTSRSYSYFLYYGDPSASSPPDTPDVVLNLSDYSVQDYGGSLQNPDTNSWEINDSGLAFHQYGNNWKALNKSYTVTGSTILELDFRNRYNGTDEQEINGVGFDTQLPSLTSSTFLQTYGTQTNFGVQTYHDYTLSPGWKHYTINVSASIATGSYTYLTFSSDEDAAPGIPDGWYRGIVLRERATADPTVTLGTERAIDINKPYVTLTAPANGTTLETSSVTLNCTVRSLNGQDLVNVTLYTNKTGSWQAEQTTSYGGTNDTAVNASFTLSLSDGSYHWNCLAWNNESNSSLAPSNNTFSIDTRTLAVSEQLSPTLVAAAGNVTVNGCVVLSDGTNASDTALWMALDGTPLNTSTLTADNVHHPPWWNYSWHYRIALNASIPSTAAPAIVRLNFTSLLAQYGADGPVDNLSLRLIEYSGNTIVGARQVQFDPARGYATGNEVADVIWLPQATGTKTYQLYFDTVADGPKPDPNYPLFRLFADSFETGETFSSYTGSAGSQDNNPSANRYNSTLFTDGTRSWEIYSNSWKELDLPSAIQLTANTTLTLSFYTTTDNEIQGVGLDDTADNTASTELDYNLAGCQWSGGSCGDWADDNENYHLTAANSYWRRLAMPAGADFYAKAGSYPTVEQVIFIDDDDAGYGGANLYDELAIWALNVTNQTSTVTTGAAAALLMTGSDGCYNFTFSAPSTQGTHTLAVNATFAGKSGSNQSTFVVDNSAPSITLLAPADGENITMPNITFQWRADDQQSWVSCDLLIDGAVSATGINSTTGTTTSYGMGGFDTGTYNWSVRCTDALDQQGSSQTWNFTVNLTTILRVSTNGTVFTNGTIVNVTLNLTDQSGTPVTDANISTRFLRATTEYDWWNTTWRYRQPFRVAVPSATDEYQLNLTLDTASLISAGKLAGDCSDLRVVNSSADEIPYWLDPAAPCGDTVTTVWVRTSLNTTGTYLFLYYGANTSVPSKSSAEAVFSYSSEQSILYVLDSFTATTSTTSVSAFYNDTHVTAGTTTLTLNQGETGTIANAQLSQGTAVKADKPIYAAHDGTSDALVPLSFAGTTFVYRIDRGSGLDYNKFFVYAPFAEANVTFYNGSPPDNYENLTVAADTVAATTIDVPDNTGVIIESTEPVLLYHASATNGNDAFALYPAGKDWWGVPSTNLQVAALENGTTVTIYWSDTTTPTTVNLDAGEAYGPGGYNASGAAPAAHVIADKPIGVSQLADGDGTESTTFLPADELSDTYVIPHATSYLAIATMQANTDCTVFNSTGGILFNASATSSEPYPGKILFGSDEGDNIPGGSRLVCTKPVYAYAEYNLGSNNGQEQNLWGVKQYRQRLAADPGVTTLSEEEYLYTEVNATDANGTRILLYQSGLYGFGTYYAWAESQPSLIAAVQKKSGDLENGTISSAAGSVPAGNASVQQGIASFTTSQSSQDITISPVNTSRAFLLVKPTSAAANANIFTFTGRFLNSTTIRLERYGSGTAARVSYSVIAASDINVTNGTTTFASSALSADVTIPDQGANYSSKTFVVLSARSDSASTSYVNQAYVTGELTGATNLHLQRDASGNAGLTVSWFVVRFLDDTSVQTGQASVTTTGTATLSPVVTNRTWLPFTSRMTTNGLAYTSIVGNLASSTQASFSRVSSSGSAEVRWFAISFSDGKGAWTQHGLQAGSGTSESVANIPITSVNTSRSFGYVTEDSTGTGTAYPRPWWTAQLTSATNIQSTRDYTGQTSNHDWQAVSWPVEPGSIDVEANKSFTAYTDVLPLTYDTLTNITVSVEVSGYDTSGSSSRGNAAANLEAQLYNGSSWVSVGLFNLTGTGSFRLTTSEPSLLVGWQDPLNRDVRVRPVDMDWVNDTVRDAIDWNAVNVTMTIRKASGVARNHTSWQIIDNSPPVVTNLSASPDPVGFGYETNLSALVTDETGVASVRFNITKPDGSVVSVTPTPGSGNYYSYLFNDTWLYGDHRFLVWAQDVSGQTSTRNITFLVGADGAISVKVANKTYGSNQDVELIGKEAVGDWWSQNYRHRRALNITETSGSDLGEYQVNFTLDTATLITAGQLRSDCADVRFTDANGTLLPYYRADIPRFACNTSQTLFYVRLNLSANESRKVYLYSDYPGASDGSSDKKTFTFSSPVSLYYVVSNRTPLGNVDVVSIADNNTITHGTSTLSLNESQVGAFTTVTQGLPISAPGAFYATGDADGTDSVAPLQFAATAFATASIRGTDSWSIYAPVSDATVCFYNGDGSTLALIGSCVSVTKGNVVNVQRDLNSLSTSNTNGGYINSTSPVIITHHAVSGSTIQDSYVLPPPGEELYGVPGTIFTLAALEDNTQVTVYESNGTSYTVTLNKGQGYEESNGQYYGAGPAYHVSADKPVFAAQVADGNGNEETIFTPDTLLSKTYYLANGYDYIAIAAAEQTTCTRYDQYGNYIDAQNSIGGSYPYPHHILFGARTGGAGDRVVCTKPVWVAYQYATTNDERNAFGLALYRQYATSTPAVSLGAVEEAPGESTLKNLGSYPFKGSLVMRVDSYANGSWSQVGIPVVDDLATSTVRTFTPGSTLYLNQTWKDAGAWNTQLRSAGDYRVVAQLYTPSGEPLNLSTITYFRGTDGFQILAPNLTIQELTHENLYEHGVNEYEVGDTLAWVNVTARNENATALNLDLTLSVLNPDKSDASWGPWETQSCGDLAPNATCTKRWDNSTAGYPIPLDATTGTYAMLWKLLFTGDNFASFSQENETFSLFDLRSRFSSTLSPSTINRNDSSVYQFGMENLFSKNLTDVNVTIDCPAVAGITCSCINGTGQTCNLSQLGSTSGVTWFNQTYAYRQPINVSNNEASTLAAGYTTSVFIDTASLYAAGKINLDCSDVRLTYMNASGAETELDREQVGSCNTPSTEFRFKTQADIPANGWDANYTLYYSNPAAGSPPENLSKVYVFADDFDDGNIDGWSQYGSGTVQYANVAGNGVILKTANNDPNGGYATFPESLSDFEVTYLFDRPNENGGQQTRYGIENSGFSGYGLQVTDVNPSGTFAIEERSGGSSAGQVVSTGTSYFALNTWYQIRQRKLGTTQNITVSNSTGGELDSLQGTDATVTSGFDRFVIHGGYDFYTDDITVRRLVTNEPTTSTGSEEYRDDVLTSAWFPSFNITTNASTPLGNYLFTVNVTYTNPGGETKLWTAQQPQLLKVTAANIIKADIQSTITNMTRTVPYDWAGLANNTNGADALNAVLEWLFPYGWTVIAGNKQTTDAVLTNGELLWNNATLQANASTALGIQQLNLTSSSDNVEGETDAVLVEIWAAINASLILSPNSTDRGSTILLNATVKLDNGTSLNGRTVTFRDETDNVTIGTNTTDANGRTSFTYTIPQDASVGNHTLTITTASEPARYYRSGSGNATLVLTSATTFNSRYVTPSPVGLGVIATINANISDGDGISSAYAVITLPNGTQRNVSLSLITGSTTVGLYQGRFNETWRIGAYNYTIVATDNNSVTTNSSQESFAVATYANLTLATQQANYSQNEQVNLSGFATWWNTSYLYRKPFNLTTTYAGTVAPNTSVKVELDTQSLVAAHKLNGNMSDLRVLWYDNATKTFTELDRIILDGDTDNTSVWFTTPASFTGSLDGLAFYYGNPSAGSPPQNIKPFIYHTRMDGATVNSNGGDLVLIPYHNDTDYTISGGITVSGTLQANQTYQNFALPSTDQTYTITSSKPLSVYTGVLEGSNPNAWTTALDEEGRAASTDFRVWGFSSSSNAGIGALWVISAENGTQYELRDQTSGALITNGTLNEGGLLKQTTGANQTLIVQATKPVIVATGKADTPASRDAQRWWAAGDGRRLGTVLWGISSNNDGLRIYNPNSSAVTVTLTDFTDGTDNASSLAVGARSSLFRALSTNDHVIRVSSTRPILVDDKYLGGANRQGDAGDYVPDADTGGLVGQRFYVHATGGVASDEKAMVWALFDNTNIQENGASLTTLNSGGSYAFNPPLDATVNVTSDKPILFLFFNEESGTDYSFAVPDISDAWTSLPRARFAAEETDPSRILEQAGVPFRGALTLTVEQNTTTGWSLVDTVVDDVANGTLRNVSAYRLLDFAQAWLDAGAWNTLTREDGLYRVVAEFTDPDGNILVTSENVTLNGTAAFRILPARVNLDMSAIRIYDVTNVTNKQSDTSNLTASGLNDTFILYKNHEYRVDIVIQTLANSDNWTINESNVTHADLNSSWLVNQSSIRYLIGENTYTGGTWQGRNVTWNTSLGGLLPPSSSMTYSYIINTSAISAQQVHFVVQGPDFGQEDRSVFRVVPFETIPPQLSGPYNLTRTVLNRGESLTAYAQWNEEIWQAWAEYNSTTSTLTNHSIALPSPNPQNWTNRTIVTNSSWLRGQHVVKIYAEDLSLNMNGTLPYLSFDVYALLRVVNATLAPDPLDLGNTTTFACRILDDANTPVTGYVVTFTNGTGLLGTNTTNSSGWAVWHYTDRSPGTENLTCTISANLTDYDNLSSPSNASLELVTKEYGVPYPTDVGQSASDIHKLENISFWAYWHDNFQLDSATLQTEETGTLTNSTLSSPITLNGTDDWANFTVQYPADSLLGYQRWRLFGNDTSGNTNQTGFQVVYVWGWAAVANHSLSPKSIIVGNWSVMSCSVIDTATSQGINGYTVSFFNSTGLLGTALTNSTGWASYNFTDDTTGQEAITCNITDAAAIYYNATNQSSASDILNTLPPGSDITPPVALNYSLSPTSVQLGENVTISARWDENISVATIFFNATSGALESVNESAPFPGNWTNHTFVINNSWLLGTHVARIVAKDLMNNTNDTLPYLSFNVTSLSQVAWLSPIGDVPRSTIQLRCNVTDNITGAPISSYPVYFYDSTSAVGSASSDASGVATLTLDGSSYAGSEDFTCRIFAQPEMFYALSGNFQDGTTLYFDGTSPSVTLNSPAENETVRSTSVTFNFTATDDHATSLTCNLTIDSVVNQTGISATSGTPTTITTPLSAGAHTWSVLCRDQAGNPGTSETRNFTIVERDLMVNGSSITFNTTSPEENETIRVFGTVWNLGGTNLTNVTVQLWKGDPAAGGVQIGANKTVNVTALGNVTVNDTFQTRLGMNDIYIVVDPEDAIAEASETNNKAYGTLVVGLWNFFMGVTNDLRVVTDASHVKLFVWNVSNATGSNIFITDTDSSIAFDQLHPLGYDINNNTVDDDFTDLDVHMNTTGFPDSVTKTYAVAGSPKASEDFTVFGHLLSSVPVVNSTNSSTFRTGILWDASDGGLSYNGSQDVVFITKLNESKQGYGGIHDYEVRVPATLRDYTGATDTVTFYAEIK